MPITKSAKKALRKDKRRAQVNRKIKDRVKAALKKTRKNPNKKNLREVFSFLDRAAKKKVIHKNRANRLKSRLLDLAKKKKS